MKNLFLVFLFLVLSTFLSAQTGGGLQETAEPNFEKVDLPYKTIPLKSGENVLFDNGPLVTLPGGGCNGGDASILDYLVGGHTLEGWGCQQNLGNYMADDFTSTDAWNIDSLKFFAYQFGATSVTITGVYVQIWNGAPNAGGTVVWGNETTNILQRTGLTNIYRAVFIIPTDCDRRVQEVVATVGTNLPPGQYWVQWGVTGSASSGPQCPPVTIQGTAVTGDALRKTSSGWAAALNGSSANGAPFIVYGNSGPPCPVGAVSNPIPADNANNISPFSLDLNWTNGEGTTHVDVYFGTQGNMVSYYSGQAITQISLPPFLDYLTEYEWKVVCSNDTCSVLSNVWSFTTKMDPNQPFYDNFENGTKHWIITNDGGTCIWEVFSPPWPNNYTIPNSAGSVFAADADECGSSTTTLTTATIKYNFDFSNLYYVYLDFDSDWMAIDTGDSAFVEVSIDGGVSWIRILTYDEIDIRNEHVSLCLSSVVGHQPNVLVRFVSIQPGYDWWWAIDNVVIWVYPTPVELTSFTAAVNENDIELNWSTATETNNKGFEVERKTEKDFGTVGFIDGYGTSTELHDYSFVDKNITPGKYFYRLKQIDFDGAFEYSHEVEVTIESPKVFSLEQNYPNPFNPTTTIKYGLPEAGQVTIKVFDILGGEIKTIVNSHETAGYHEIEFDGKSLSSGIYFCRMKTENYTNTIKMIISK